MKNKKIKALSLFANVGIGESYLSETNVEVVLANELLKDRVEFYKHLYPETEMIMGDITEPDVLSLIVDRAKELGVNLIMATPPCQGMSTAGKKDEHDERNSLIKYAVKIIKEVNPDYVFFENVPEQLTTRIWHNGEFILIPDFLRLELGIEYNFSKDNVVNAADYSVPQYRERAIILLTKKTKKTQWDIPKKDSKVVTMKDAIGNLPSLDPLIYDIPYDEHLKVFPQYEEKKERGLSVSKWHCPPEHVYRQVYSLMHTPTGKTAFDNIDEYKPKKKDGTLVKGYKNTYKRQNWDTPAYTITMYNRTIGSQNNVHPGTYIGQDKDGSDLYSDARVLTIYEIMLVMSLPADWNIPDWATDNFIRSVIGEGVPPLLVKKIMEVIPDET